VPPVTPEAEALESTQADVRGTEAQAQAQSQQQPTPSVPDTLQGDTPSSSPNQQVMQPEVEPES
jgi:hypothetical protein